MGEVRDMAYSVESINWEARARVEELSQRPDVYGYSPKVVEAGSVWAFAFCVFMAVLFVVSVVIL